MTARGAISADRATTVTYHWARSDGTSSGSATRSVAAGGSASVSDSVTPASNNWEIGDTLTVTAPSSHSATAKLAFQCSFPALSASNSGSESANEGSPMAAVTVTASGGNGSYQFSLSGPSWMSLSASGSTATVTGTPPFTDSNCARTPYTATVTVTDTEASAQTASTSFTITALSTCLR
jgi:hypothetical protein